MMTKDESWGYQAYYWGAGNHVSGSLHNVTWGEEADMQSQMRQMRLKYTSKGIPVIIGEFGALWRKMPEGESQEKHDASIYSWYYTLCRYAVYNGLVPFVWDTNACQRPSMDVLNRKTLTVFNQQAFDGIIQGCASVKWPYVTGIESLSPLGRGDEYLIYDLQGRLLSSKTSAKHLSTYGAQESVTHLGCRAPVRGFYIVNGKKYIR